MCGQCDDEELHERERERKREGKGKRERERDTTETRDIYGRGTLIANMSSNNYILPGGGASDITTEDSGILIKTASLSQLSLSFSFFLSLSTIKCLIFEFKH